MNRDGDYTDLRLLNSTHQISTIRHWNWNITKLHNVIKSRIQQVFRISPELNCRITFKNRTARHSISYSYFAALPQMIKCQKLNAELNGLQKQERRN